MQPIHPSLPDESTPSTPSSSLPSTNPVNFNGRHVHFNQETESDSQLFSSSNKPSNQAPKSLVIRKRALLQTQDSKLLPTQFRKQGDVATSTETSDTTPTLQESREKKAQSIQKNEVEKSPNYCFAGLIQLSSDELKKFQRSYSAACASCEEDESSSSDEEQTSEPKLTLSMQVSKDIYTQFYSQLTTLSQKSKLEQVITQVLETSHNYHTVMAHLKSLKQQRHLKDLRAHLFQFIINELKTAQTAEQKQALIAITIIAVNQLQSHQIFACQSLLKQLEVHSFELHVLFHKKLENFTEFELLNSLAYPDNQKVVLSTHGWLTNPRRLIRAWCQVYQSPQDNDTVEKKLHLLHFLLSFLSVPHGALSIKDYMNIRKVLNNDLLADQTCAYQNVSQEVIKKIMPFIRNLSQKESQKSTSDLNTASSSHNTQPCSMYALQSQFSERIEQTSFDNCVKEFAQDLHAYYAKLIAPIPHEEFVNHNWTLPDHSPHFQVFLEHTNAFTSLVTAHILKPKSETERAFQCQFYLHAAYQSIQLGNFAGAYAILGAFNKPSIQYLHLTWDSVPQESKKIKKKLENWINPFSNFSVYRKRLEQASLDNTLPNSFIPILEVFIKDLFMIDEGNPNFLADGHLNLEKLELFSTVYQSLHTHQERLSSQQGLISHAYQFKLEDSILATIKRMEEIKQTTPTESTTTLSALDAYDNYLYSRFKQREPKREQPM